MEFENDVFVSYAHIDDQALAEGQKGWISSLHASLQVRLEQLLGKETKIWRDPKLQGNDIFADRLVDRLPKVAVLVSVLSPRYVKSEWCQRELNEFLKAAEATGGARVADKLRVFKVVKTPFPREQQPQDLQTALGYEFYTLEQASGRQRELGPMSPPDAQRLYWVKLDDLAHDIADLLTILEGQTSGTAPSPVASRGTVYLAETSSDVKDRRDSIRRELLGHGYTVLPDQPLPLVGADCAAFVREQLVALPAVGARGRSRTTAWCRRTRHDSIVVLQHELAIERAAAGDFCRLIWMPPDLTTDDERQQQVHRTPPDRFEASGRRRYPEDGARGFQERPARPPHAVRGAEAWIAVRRSPEQDALKRIYLICDSRDIDQVQPLAESLFNDFEVILPVFEGDEAQVRHEHEANLAECDAALIYYGAGNELWLRSKLRELQKIAGYGRTKPMLAKAVYVAPPESADKQRFRTHEAIVINPWRRV